MCNCRAFEPGPAKDSVEAVGDVPSSPSQAAFPDAAERRLYALLNAATVLLGDGLVMVASLGKDAIRLVDDHSFLKNAVDYAKTLLDEIERRSAAKGTK